MIELKENTKNNNLRVCQCGCLQPTELGQNKKYNKFVHGHNSKGNNHPNWKGGRIIINGYILIYKPDHPYATIDGYMLEHRLVMEEYLGRYLDSKEVVHHINKNKQDNRIENLLLFENHGKHVSYERIINMSDRICIKCKSNTSYIKKDGLINWYGNKKDGFICKKCYDEKRLLNKRSV